MNNIHNIYIIQIYFNLVMFDPFLLSHFGSWRIAAKVSTVLKWIP